MTDRIEGLASRLIASGEPFCLMLVRIPELEVIYDRMEPTAYARAVRHAVGVAAAAMKATDEVGLVGAGKLMIALPESGGADSLAVADDIGRALSSAVLPAPHGQERLLRPEIAVVAFRHPAVLKAQGVLDQMWRAGGAARFGATRLVVGGTTDPLRTACQYRQSPRCPRSA